VWSFLRSIGWDGNAHNKLEAFWEPEQEGGEGLPAFKMPEWGKAKK
jgi:hypothetical protein